MSAPPLSTAARLGFRAAILATTCSLIYVVAQVAEWLGWLGSAGGPANASTALGLFVLLTPSLFLAPAFLLVVVSLHDMTDHMRRVWSTAALAFAILYVAFVTMAYFVQLTLIAPNLAQRDTPLLRPFLFLPFQSFFYAVDLLGYSFMSAATLSAALALPDEPRSRVARGFLVANGFLLPFLALQMYYPPLIWGASAWAITFPGATIALAYWFRSTAPPSWVQHDPAALDSDPDSTHRALAV